MIKQQKPKAKKVIKDTQRTKKEFINELLLAAKDNIWKNQLALKFATDYPSGTSQEQDLKIKSCEHAIKKDTEYIAFLNIQLNETTE